MRKISSIVISCLLIVIISSTSIYADDSDTTPFTNVAMNSEPILKAKINPRFDYGFIYFTVENIGDTTAHNVTYSNVSFEGNVLYNSRPMILAQELEPGQKDHGNTDIFIGFGFFTVTISVTCDEGVSDNTSANGIVFGPFYFIP